ncbi:MAG: hypothetical protein E7588_06265 [Ruminococcaceae bacterium]|nr:hypothetical protein [Oscillospiraceae bacterium]
MKKIISLLLVFTLCAMLFVSCTQENDKPDVKNNNDVTETDDSQGDKTTSKPDKSEKEDELLTELRKQISDSGAKLGVAYLGYFVETFDDTKDYFKYLGLYEDYPFVEEMELGDLIVNENNEMYLVVPADSTETVKVYDAVPDEETYELEKGELLGESANGKPFLLLCNVSEIIPNVIISTSTLEYSPCLSGEDGELVENQDIYDFSPYEKIKEYYDIQNGLADGADPIFCGSWFGESENGDYELMSMSLELYVDGTATYVYGVGNSEPVEWFMGEWSFDAERDMIILDMYGGPPNDYEDSDELFIDPYELKCGFKWDMDYRDDGTYLILTHEEGDPILWGKNGATFEFAEASGPEEEEDYSYLIGSWGIISEKSETYLELFPDGSAHYYVTRDDVTEKDLRGSWHAEALTLYLTLGENEALTGAYGIMYDGELLILSILDDFAEPLTAFMAENGYDSFILCGVG